MPPAETSKRHTTAAPTSAMQPSSLDPDADMEVKVEEYDDESDESDIEIQEEEG